MSMLNSEEIERYARHLMLKEIGGAGQQRLKNARVALVGVGGLGAPCALYLASSGIGHITLIDDDVVSLSNLQRQVLFTSDDIGLNKASCGASRLNALNPHCSYKAVDQRLSRENAISVLQNHDLVIDGSDNFATRYAVADFCETLKIPLLTAAVARFDAQMTLLKPFISNSPSLRDVFGEEPPRDVIPPCTENGVLGALTGVIGTMLALEAVKELCEFGETLLGKLILIDTLTWQMTKIETR